MLKKVITYGTYDMLHYGHIRLLERAKALGDYLIVGITADDFDKKRGKINVQQSLSERIEAVRQTGIADEIIVEEYEGQKIDDIRKYDIDIFTVGSDWRGHFDYLSQYCDVRYLERTQGISSTDLRNEKFSFRLGLVGNSGFLEKIISEAKFCNGINLVGVCTDLPESKERFSGVVGLVTESFDEILGLSDAVYIHSHPDQHYDQVKKALSLGKHVLCESPIALKKEQCIELFNLATKNNVVLSEGLRTAYATAFDRMMLLVKSGLIGRVISVDAVCTSRKRISADDPDLYKKWNSITSWGPTAILPIFKLLGMEYKDVRITSSFIDEAQRFDTFSKIDFTYSNATASIKVGVGMKSEGEMIISGTDGYVYVPAPWWKTDYFELRYENSQDNKRYFYQLDGEGIRYELSDFAKSVEHTKVNYFIEENMSIAFADIMERFYSKINMTII